MYKNNPVFLKVNRQADTKGGYEQRKNRGCGVLSVMYLLSRELCPHKAQLPFFSKKARIRSIMAVNMGSIEKQHDVNIVKIILTSIRKICYYER